MGKDTWFALQPFQVGGAFQARRSRLKASPRLWHSKMGAARRTCFLLMHQEGSMLDLRLPRRFNAAEYFIDRHIEEGRGAKTAILSEKRA